MKKTLAVLLVFAMVASVCGILFVSADEAATDENQNAGAVELVKPEAATELEAALADKVAKEAPADAAFAWDLDVEVEGNKVTAVVTAPDLYEKGTQLIFVDTWLRYNSNELVLVTVEGNSGLECVTSPTDSAWENLSTVGDTDFVVGADDFDKSFDKCVSMCIMNFEDLYFTAETPVIFTLEFEFVEGVTVAGLFIDAGSTATDMDLAELTCSGDSAVAYVPVEVPVTPPHTHEYTSAVTAEPTLSTEGVITYTCECGDSYTEAIPAVKVQPDELVTLPEGALVLDNAGYLHDSFHCVIAGDNLTVSELTALGNNGAAKDMNYFYVIVVNAEGVVTETWFTLGRPEGVKSDVVCPAGGYIIGFNGNKADASALLDVKVGATVTLFNVDLDALRGAKGNVAVENAGITYVNPAPVEDTKVDVNVNDNSILTDGNTGFAGDWGTVGTDDVLLIQNGNCAAAGMDVTLNYALVEAKKINGVTIDLYHCAGVMIGYPEGQATVLVSLDGESWTEVGKYDLAAADMAAGNYGTVSNTFSFDEIEAAYVKVLLYAGSNEAVLGTEPTDGKIFWEFIAVAEIAVSEVPAVEIYETPEEIVNAAYELENGEFLSDGHEYTLTGEIISIQTAYSEQYKNVSVVIAIEGLEAKPILCYRLKGEGADVIKIGDTITVTGKIKNYNGTIEFDSGCILESYVPGAPEVIIYETAEEIVNAAYELDKGATLSAGHLYTLTGVIVSIDTEYSEQYGNITVTIQVGDMTDKLMKCYRLKGEGAADLKVGDTITVTGAIKNYNGTVEFDAGCTLDEVVPAPVPENSKVEINVNDNSILTDGNTGFTGNWGEVGTGDVLLIANPNCTTVGMDVTLYYALGETKKLDGVTIDLYHCAGVMIGYPEGQATVLVSLDGENWTEVGKYDLAAADMANGNYGTVSSTFSFDEIEAAYVKVLLYAGSNEAVLGTEPSDGKIFWEFISVAEFAVSEAVPEPDEPSEPDEPVVEGKDILVSHVNCYTWGVYNQMIITGEGQNSTTRLGYDCTWWIAIKVDKVDGVYTVTQIEGNGEAKEMTASADGFILYCYSNDAPSFEAAQAIVVGDVLLNTTVDWSTDVASETAVGTLTFGAAPVEEPSEPDDDSSAGELPPAGDVGVLVFAILGLLAIAGAAVVIRVRH